MKEKHKILLITVLIVLAVIAALHKVEQLKSVKEFIFGSNWL